MTSDQKNKVDYLLGIIEKLGRINQRFVVECAKDYAFPLSPEQVNYLNVIYKQYGGK